MQASRYDVRDTHRFLLKNPTIAALCAALLVGAAVASLAGFLRWQWIGARISFAVLAVLAAGYCIERAFRARRTPVGVNLQDAALGLEEAATGRPLHLDQAGRARAADVAKKVRDVADT